MTESDLKKNFQGKTRTDQWLPSDAAQPAESSRVDQLVLDPEKRGRMPLTKDKYIVPENPDLIQWEREVRRFVHKLSSYSGHRITAVMIYEWATGRDVTEMVNALTEDPDAEDPRPDLRKLNKILRFYFGKAYMTHLAGRKVKNAYRVPKHYKIYYHRPMTLTLHAEWGQGVLNP